MSSSLRPLLIFMSNLFRIYWGRSTAFFYSYSSLTYSRGTHEIPTRKNFGRTKYPRENISDSRNTHDKKFWSLEGMVAQSHETQEIHDGKRPLEFSPLSTYVVWKTAAVKNFTNNQKKHPW